MNLDLFRVDAGSNTVAVLGYEARRARGVTTDSAVAASYDVLREVGNCAFCRSPRRTNSAAVGAVANLTRTWLNGSD